MITIKNDLIELLKAHTYPMAGVKARDYYSTEKLSPPQISLLEIPSNEGIYLDGDPSIVRNTFQVEVYSKAMSVGGKLTPAPDAAMQLMIEADKVLTSKSGGGLTMVGDPIQAPYATDNTVSRVVARYITYIDTRPEMNNQHYRNP